MDVAEVRKSNAADNDDSMLVIKVDNDEESNKSKNRPKKTINIKIQQNDKLKEENARLKKIINKKNQTIKQSRKENLDLQQKIEQLLLKQNCNQQTIGHEYLLLNQENERIKKDKVAKTIDRVNSGLSNCIIRNQTLKERKILANIEIKRLLEKLNSINPSLVNEWNQYFENSSIE
ncbi:7521_t:CDS:2, partial [Racocetra fulgida]